MKPKAFIWTYKTLNACSPYSSSEAYWELLKDLNQPQKPYFVCKKIQYNAVLGVESDLMVKFTNRQMGWQWVHSWRTYLIYYQNPPDQNPPAFLVFPLNLVSKVITRARSSTALKLLAIKVTSLLKTSLPWPYFWEVFYKKFWVSKPSFWLCTSKNNFVH